MVPRHGFGFEGVLVNADGAIWHQAANIAPHRVSGGCNVLQEVTAPCCVSFMQPIDDGSH
jgi:hypothetical protein